MTVLTITSTIDTGQLAPGQNITGTTALQGTRRTDLVPFAGTVVGRYDETDAAGELYVMLRGGFIGTTPQSGLHALPASRLPESLQAAVAALPSCQGLHEGNV